MRLFTFSGTSSRPITQFDSVYANITPIARPTGFVQLGCIRLAPGGRVGYHQADIPQLFLVIEGAGWVRGEAPERVAIIAGQAAFWAAGEGHESGTETGMAAIVLEAETLDPAHYLTEEPTA
ncbi:MAG: hypothetical protein OJF49_004100 [Ktedonobacterales bacterium]|jgi:quercetin dioxygenase-like cupin family protein|nr:MAG: hypothetical protein OJF49_004100 [Ktedonobacterales bacterium]